MAGFFTHVPILDAIQVLHGLSWRFLVILRLIDRLISIKLSNDGSEHLLIEFSWQLGFIFATDRPFASPQLCFDCLDLAPKEP